MEDILLNGGRLAPKNREEIIQTFNEALPMLLKLLWWPLPPRLRQIEEQVDYRGLVIRFSCGILKLPYNNKTPASEYAAAETLKVTKHVGSADLWNHRLWNWLHASSILISNRTQTIQFASVMQNLHFILPCPTCYVNYLNHDISSIVIERLLDGKDPALILFNLHNIVNVSKAIPTPPFSLEAFIKKYDLYVVSNR